MKTITERITEHHQQEFGDVEISWILVKLMEEVGECSSSIYDHVYMEKPDPEYRDKLKHELGDVATVLAVIAGRFGMDINEILCQAAERFEGRTW